MKQTRDYRKYGIIGTVLFHAAILMMLIFWGMRTMAPQEEGLLVNFGDSQDGAGMEEPKQSEPQTQPEPVQEVTPPPPPKQTPTEAKETVKESVNTQDFEEAAALKAEQKKKAEKERIEKEKIRQQQIEIQKQKDAEAKKLAEAQEAERKKQAELARQATEAKNRVSNAFAGKGTGNSTSEGVTSGSGNQGSLTGDPNSQNRTGGGTGSGTKGSGFSLTGRSLVGKLPQPEYAIQEEGIVVIEITVDKNGTVTNATPVLKGTTTQNSYLWKVATDAAKKAKFNADPNAASFQKGTITYHFVLN